MHIILFILIAVLLIEQLGQNYLYEKFDFITDTFGNLHSTIYFITGTFAILFATLILYKCIKNKTFKPQKWDVCFILMLMWGLISVILASDKEFALVGSHRLDGYYSYLIYASVYIGVRTLKSDKVRLWLIRFFVIVSTCLCMDCIFNDSLTSIFFNQNHFGYLLTLSSMLLCGLFIFEKKLFLKIAYAVLFLINIFSLIFVDTFGCYLAVLIGLVFVLFFIPTTKKGKNYWISSLIIFVLFLLMSFITNLNPQTINNSFEELNQDIEKIVTNAPDVEDAGSYRIRLWKHAFKYIKEKPVFGYGPEGTFYAWIFQDGVSYDRPHNEYIQTALFMGIPAAIFYLTGLFMLFIYCIKNRKQLPSYAIISGTAVFAYCISAFFGNSMYYTTPYFFMMLGMLSPILQKE